MRGVADAEVVVRPVEFRSTQAVGGACHKGCGGVCGSEGDQLTVRLHGQGRTLQKRVEGGCTEAGLPGEGVGLLQGGLPLEGEAGQAEVAPTFTAAVAVKSSPAGSVAMGGGSGPTAEG